MVSRILFCSTLRKSYYCWANSEQEPVLGQYHDLEYIHIFMISEQGFYRTFSYGLRLGMFAADTARSVNALGCKKHHQIHATTLISSVLLQRYEPQASDGNWKSSNARTVMLVKLN